MKPLIVANWKCNPATAKEAKQLFDSIKKGIKNTKKAEVVICPPFVYLPAVASGGGGFAIGAQDCFWEKIGAYTGEISPLMLKKMGCQYVIIGHSERRKYFFETDETVNKKIKAALEVGLKPILCIGETKKEREEGSTENVLRGQLFLGLKDISSAKVSKIIIAYEPIWAIGTGNPCDVEEAQKMGLVIFKTLSEIYNLKIADKIPILYGGSVNSKNASGYIKEAGLGGLLVGGVSLEAKEFVNIVKSAVS